MEEYTILALAPVVAVKVVAEDCSSRQQHSGSAYKTSNRVLSPELMVRVQAMVSGADLEVVGRVAIASLLGLWVEVQERGIGAMAEVGRTY